MTKKKIGIALAFIAIFIVALLLRIKAIPKEGLWFDELYSVWVASGSFPQGILERLYTDDAHTPLYHFILHFYIKFFGSAPVGFFVFNIIITMFTFPLTYFLGCEVAGGKNNENAYKFGLFATLLLAFNYFHIAFSQETRFYNLTAVLLTISTLFLFKQINSGFKKRYLAGVLLPNILMCYTITPGCIYVFIQALVFGIYFLIHKRELIKPLAISSFLALLFYTPYVPFVFHQFEISHNSFMGPYALARIDTPYIIEIFYYWFAQAPMVYAQLKDILDLSLDYNRASLALYITEAALLILFLSKSLTLKDEKGKLIFALLASLCGFHLAFLIFHIAPYMPRYNNVFMPIIAVCFAGALNNVRTRWIKVLVLSFIIAPGLLYFTPAPYKTSFMRYGRTGPGIEILKSYNLTPDDRIFKTHSAKLLPPMGIRVTPIDICMNATNLFYNPRRLEMIFGDEYLEYKTREEKDNFLEDYMFDPEINIHNREYYNKQVNEMKKGAKLALWLPTSDFDYINFTEKYGKFKNHPREDKKALIENLTPTKEYYKYMTKKVEEDYRKLATRDKRLRLLDAVPMVSSSILIFEKIKD